MGEPLSLMKGDYSSHKMPYFRPSFPSFIPSPQLLTDVPVCPRRGPSWVGIAATT